MTIRPGDQTAYSALAAADPDKAYLFAYSLYDTANDIESGLSPYTMPVLFSEVANDQGVVPFNVEIDLSGYAIQGGDVQVNSVPSEDIHVRLYACRLAWGVDTITEYPFLKMLVEVPVPPADGPGGSSRILRYTNARSETDILSDRSPVYDRVPAPPCTILGVDGQRVVFSGVTPYSVGRVTTFAEGHRVRPLRAYTRVSDGATIYSDTAQGAGYLPDWENTPQFGAWLRNREIRIAGDPATYWVRDVVTPPGEMVADENFADADSWPTTGAGWSFGKNDANQTCAKFRGSTSADFPAGGGRITYTVPDGIVVPGQIYPITVVVSAAYFCWATHSGYTASLTVILNGISGTIPLVAGSSTVSVVAGAHGGGTSGSTGDRVVLFAMGGKGCEIDVTAISIPLPGDGISELYVERGANSDPFTANSDVAYKLSGDLKDNGLTYEIMGYPTRFWFSEVSIGSGLVQECTRLTNYLDINMPGEEIKGVVGVHGMFGVVGQQHTAFYNQNNNAIDDVPTTGAPYPSTQILAGGTVSGRTIATMLDGSATWLTPNGTIARASMVVSTTTAQGVTETPVSGRIGDWIRNWKRIDTRLLKEAHGVFVQELGAYALFLRPSTDTAMGLIPEQPPVDQYARWQS
jgi:hypothetical protein